VVLPVLRARRRRRVDVAVLSHPHPDHFTGLASALPDIGVGEFWDTGQGEAQGAGATYAKLLAALRKRGVPIRRPDSLCEAPFDLGGARVHVLAPCPRVVLDEGANDNSLVIRIEYGRRSVLLVGDAEAAEEARLRAAHPDELRSDLLKVGHHGSRTSSSPAFLEVVRPSFATISAGVRNRFGHPHPNTLRTLGNAKIPIGRTDDGGAIVWETDGNAVWISRP
jgi:competence protein ComEC